MLDWDTVKASSPDTTAPTPTPREIAAFGRFDIMNLAYETMQATLTSYKLAGYPPDVLIEIPKSSARTFEFHGAAELIDLGRRLTEEALGGGVDHQRAGGLRRSAGARSSDARGRRDRIAGFARRCGVARRSPATIASAGGVPLVAQPGPRRTKDSRSRQFVEPATSRTMSRYSWVASRPGCRCRCSW